MCSCWQKILHPGLHTPCSVFKFFSRNKHSEWSHRTTELSLFLFTLREIERASGGGAEREEDRIPSGSHTVLEELDAGLELTNHEIMIWAEIKSQSLHRLSRPGAPRMTEVKQLSFCLSLHPCTVPGCCYCCCCCCCCCFSHLLVKQRNECFLPQTLETLNSTVPEVSTDDSKSLHTYSQNNVCSQTCPCQGGSWTNFRFIHGQWTCPFGLYLHVSKTQLQ